MSRRKVAPSLRRRATSASKSETSKASAAPRTGVASLGVRPTIRADGKPLLEVFVFDFEETIYGRRVTVQFLHKLRDEERYPDLETLSRQICDDVARAREYFAAHQ